MLHARLYSMNAIFTLFGASIAIASILTGLAFLGQKPPAIKPARNEAIAISATPSLPAPSVAPTQSIGVELGFVGDIMLDRGVLQSVEKNFNGDFRHLFDNLAFLKDYDILFGNLEGPVSLSGQNVGSKWSFRMKPVVTEVLAEAGFDILSLANNHMGDWASEAMLDTLDYLKMTDVMFTGAGANLAAVKKPTIIKKNGLRIGFLAFSDVGPAWLAAKENTPGILIIRDNYKDIIKNAAENVDILIVSMHWGEEYKTRSNTREQTLGHGAIEAGAKIVIGHHPHVIQEIERYRGGLIAYSLGNFIFDQYFSEETMRGKLLELKLAKNPFTQKADITETKEKLIKLNKFFQPAEIIETKNYIESVKETAKSAIPNVVTTPCPAGNSDQDFLLFNINPKNGIGNFIPKDLVPIAETNCLRREAARAFALMQNTGKDENLSFSITSGFRDETWQKTLYENWSKANAAATFLAVAKPTHSEHQLGTALDLTTGAIGNLAGSDLFATTKEYEWLTANAYKYGFVLSYPAGKELITGYKFEPWHWRYVGLEMAKKIKETAGTLLETL